MNIHGETYYCAARLPPSRDCPARPAWCRVWMMAGATAPQLWPALPCLPCGRAPWSLPRSPSPGCLRPSSLPGQGPPCGYDRQLPRLGPRPRCPHPRRHRRRRRWPDLMAAGVHCSLVRLRAGYSPPPLAPPCSPARSQSSPLPYPTLERFGNRMFTSTRRLRRHRWR